MSDTSLSDRATITNIGCVTLTRLLPGPIERIWQHLTDTKFLPAWFGKGKIEAREGGTVNFMGWHTFLDILNATLLGETVKSRADYFEKNAALYGVDMKNLRR